MMIEYKIKIYMHVLVAVFKSRQIEIVFHEDKWWINASALLDHLDTVFPRTIAVPWLFTSLK